MLKPLVEEMGAPWAGFHTVFHTFASIHLSEGTNLVALYRPGLAPGRERDGETEHEPAPLAQGTAAVAVDPDDEPLPRPGGIGSLVRDRDLLVRFRVA